MAMLIVFLVFFGGMFAIALLYTRFSAQVEKRRSRSMSELADKLHMKFHENGIENWEQKLPSMKFPGYSEMFTPYVGNRRRRMYNALKGMNGDTSLLIFDFDYSSKQNTQGPEASRMEHRVTVIVLETPALSLPAFEMQPLGHNFKILRSVNSDDIIFDDMPSFSEKYYLKGDDRKAVRDLFDRQKRTLFIAHPGFSIEGKGTQLLFHNSTINTPSSRIAVDAIETRLKTCIDVSKVFMQ